MCSSHRSIAPRRVEESGAVGRDIEHGQALKGGPKRRIEST